PAGGELFDVVHPAGAGGLDLAGGGDRAGIELDLHVVRIDVGQVQKRFDLHVLTDLIMPVAAGVNADDLDGAPLGVQAILGARQRDAALEPFLRERDAAGGGG